MRGLPFLMFIGLYIVQIRSGKRTSIGCSECLIPSTTTHDSYNKSDLCRRHLKLNPFPSFLCSHSRCISFSFFNGFFYLLFQLCAKCIYSLAQCLLSNPVIACIETMKQNGTSIQGKWDRSIKFRLVFHSHPFV